MIVLQNVDHTKVMYLKKKEIMYMVEEETDEGTDVDIAFKKSVLDQRLIIENIKLMDVMSKLDSTAWEPLIREFYW